MISALVLVVLVSTAEAHSTATAALERSAEEALGADASVSVRVVSESPSASELAHVAPDADLVASIEWLDSEHRRAAVRCYIASEHRLVTRELGFDEPDRLSERGRLIGLSVAAMAPEAHPERPAAEAPEEPPAPPKRRSSRPGADEPADTGPEPRGSPKAVLGALDLVGLGAVGLGGPASGVGAGLSARWFFVRTLSLRLGGGFRRGSVDAARAGSQFAYGAVGLGFTFAEAAHGKFSFGGRGDALVGSFGMRRRTETDDPPEHRERFQAGADLLLESCWYLGENAGIVFGAGGEFAFGDTDVVVGGRAVTDIPPLRAVAEVGARARF